MEILRTISEVKAAVRPRKRAGARVGLVPTMGYLHEGHLSLVRRARQETDLVVVSIFVNPLQFGPREDYDRYPRDLDRDAALLAPEGVDIVFAPSVEEMYPEPIRTFVEVTGLTEGLCGASRPGHFRGVTTVVTKLFNIVEPDVAYFGEKDFQQLQVVRRMVRDLNMNVEIVGVPTVREPDGLALSSRNVYLRGREREAARILYRAIQRAQELVAQGQRDARALVEDLTAFIAREPLARVDYVAVVDPETLAPVERIEGRVRLALAVYIGSTRLIDNAELAVDNPELEGAG